MSETTDEVTYEEKPPLRVIATYQNSYGKVGLRDYMILPNIEEGVAEMVERDPNFHCFFIEASTDMTDMETIPLEQYQAFKEAEAAAALEGGQTEEV